MHPYPYRNSTEQAILEHMPASPFAADDRPYLSVARYSHVGIEARDVEDKRILDAQGTEDNLWFYNFTQQENRAINLGQR